MRRSTAFRVTERGLVCCSCGGSLDAKFPICAACHRAETTSETDAPPFLEKARNFAASAARHVAAGMPQASEEQVAERFAVCQGCKHFDGKACRKCGCLIVRERKFLSKLSWANESCPIGKWGPQAS
jgi:hypothetical protein